MSLHMKWFMRNLNQNQFSDPEENMEYWCAACSVQFVTANKLFYRLLAATVV